MQLPALPKLSDIDLKKAESTFFARGLNPDTGYTGGTKEEIAGAVSRSGPLTTAFAPFEAISRFVGGKITGQEPSEETSIFNLASKKAEETPIIGDIPLAPFIVGLIAEAPLFGAGAGKKAVGEAPEAFKGFKDLTTKVLKRLEGKSITSKEEILDFTNMPELRQAERGLIRDVLKDFKGTQVAVKEFAERVQTRLLRLTRAWDTPRYEGIRLPDELRGPVANYKEVIYESPIKTSAGQKHYDGFSDNYFAHTRVEDLGKPTVVGEMFDVNVGRPGGKNVELSFTDTRRVVELQSDLFQKGGLTQETSFSKSRLAYEDYATPQQLKEARKLDAKMREPNFRSRENPDIVRRWADLMDEIRPARTAEVARLEPYRNTWHERIIREEVKQAAKDGKKKLQFPTGETAMKIEGLGEVDQFAHVGGGGEIGHVLRTDNMRVGDIVARSGTGRGTATEREQFIITEILEGGKFKAVPKWVETNLKKEFKTTLDELKNAVGGRDANIYVESFTETFDISSKIDTSSPIFRFYEKEVGRYLKSRYNARPITDPQGVKWWEVDVKPEWANDPIEAFVATPLLLQDNGD